jgi:hypothetical protein
MGAVRRQNEPLRGRCHGGARRLIWFERASVNQPCPSPPAVTSYGKPPVAGIENNDAGLRDSADSVVERRREPQVAVSAVIDVPTFLGGLAEGMRSPATTSVAN